MRPIREDGPRRLHLSFRTLLDDLATVVKNTVQHTGGAPAFDMITTPTPVQKRALDALAGPLVASNRKRLPTPRRILRDLRAYRRGTSG